MRKTLRRSCDACAKAKYGCDLSLPRCSRCVKRHCPCVYANEPLTSLPDSHPQGPKRITNHEQAVQSAGECSTSAGTDTRVAIRASDTPAGVLKSSADASFDPFDSYPATRLPRALVQRLIHHCIYLLP